MSDSSPTLKDRELAGYVAPIIRSTDERVLRRRVHTYNPETGEVTGEVTMREVVGGLAKATALGLEVVEGTRPTSVSCKRCGRCVKVSPAGKIPTTCRTRASGRWSDGCTRPVRCAVGCRKKAPLNQPRGWVCGQCEPRVRPTCGRCQRKAPAKAMTPSHVARRGGAPWVCTQCDPAVRPQRQSHCAGWGSPCERVPSAKAFTPARRRQRNGRLWRCQRCAWLAASCGYVEPVAAE